MSIILSNLIDTWNRSHCSQCLAHPFDTTEALTELGELYADNISPNVTFPDYNYAAYNNDTLEYFTQLNKTVACISNFISNTTTTFLDIANFPPPDELKFNSSVCQFCREDYHQLTTVYKKWASSRYDDEDTTHWYLPKDCYTFPYHGLCSDVSDALNRTQWAWFHLFNCSVNAAYISPVVALLPLILCTLLFIIFHAILLCICHHPTHVMIYRQSRVEAAQRFHSLSWSNDENLNENTSLNNPLITSTSSATSHRGLRSNLSMLFQKRRDSFHTNLAPSVNQ